jgi:hypothetical protein
LTTSITSTLVPPGQRHGRIAEVLVQPSSQVEAGDLLLRYNLKASA